MGFDFLSAVVLDIQTWAFFHPILESCQNEGLGMSHDITVLKNWSQKWITNLKKTIVFEFDLFSTIGM